VQKRSTETEGNLKRFSVLLLMVLGTSVTSLGQFGDTRCGEFFRRCASAPEIDPGNFGTASALAASILLMARRQRKGN
jgi:hypothetical protein